MPIIGKMLLDRDRLRNRINHLEAEVFRIKNLAEQNYSDVMTALRLPLPVPKNMTEESLYEFVTSVMVVGAPEEEMRNYGAHDFRRFVYTLGLTKNIKGKCLELGANPYFTTMLLDQFTDLELILANYFGEGPKGVNTQNVHFRSLGGERLVRSFDFHHFNIEQDEFPFSEREFDVVIFAEIIEHLLMDPCRVLREIKRVLKSDGVLILTTPNVARLENVTKIVAGANIYDPYSGYGPYGRHNREFNVHELVALLRYEGFEVEECFTSDVHGNMSEHYANVRSISDQLVRRKADLGQYIFLRAKNTHRESFKRPSWLYRSMPNEAIEQIDL